MKFLLPFTLVASLAAAQYYPGEEAARDNATATAVPGTTSAPDPNTFIHPSFENDLNYLRARANSGDRKSYVPGIYVCKGPGWVNDCVWQRLSADVCMGLPESDRLAVGPDIGIQCKFFAEKNCKGKETDGLTVAPGVMEFKGYQGLSGPPAGYKCRWCADKQKDCGYYNKKPGAWSAAG